MDTPKVNLAKQYYQQGDPHTCLRLLKEAYLETGTPKIAEKIRRLESQLGVTNYANKNADSTTSTPLPSELANCSKVDIARYYYEHGDNKKCLHYLKQAYQEKPTEKLALKIQKLEEQINQQSKENISPAAVPPPSATIQEQANAKLLEAKQLYLNGFHLQSLVAFKEAYSLTPNARLADKIRRFEAQLKEEKLDVCSEFESGMAVKAAPRAVEALTDSVNSLQIRQSGSPERSLELDSLPVASTPMPSRAPPTKPAFEDTPKFKLPALPTAPKVSAPTYDELMDKARRLCEVDNDLKTCIFILKEAYTIRPSEKLQNKIERLERLAAEEDKNEEDDAPSSPEPARPEVVSASGGVALAPDFHVSSAAYNKIYHHQRQGLAWLWSLHRQNKGGILADDMGLGKTVQISVFLSEMFAQDRIRHAIIVMPVSLLPTWKKELKTWAFNVPVHDYHQGTPKQRESQLQRLQRFGGVLLTTYGMVVSNYLSLAAHQHKPGRDFCYDYVILDEGHKIKNPQAKATKALHSIIAKHRIVLTGTAVQNNLSELWSLFDFVHHGTLLGNHATFKRDFERPILRSREKDVTGYEMRIGMEMAESLRRLIEPYFLRRTKATVESQAKAATAAAIAAGVKSDHVAPQMPTLTRKNDLVVWLFLAPFQISTYHDFLKLDQVKELLLRTNKRSPLMELTILKKICDHPRLLSTLQCLNLGIEVALPGEDVVREECAANRIDLVPSSQLIAESGKLEFLVPLMTQLKREGHRTLIFSKSLKILNMIMKILKERNHGVLQLDGTLKTDEREEVVRRFEKYTNVYDTMLLTTQVGGVGLTLTAADRVVIYDPSWNPATDAQAVDRAFRIGQKANVVVYRLITCGTVEEKIYRRQIFKDSITRQTTGNHVTDENPTRYFTHQQLKELFELGRTDGSNTQEQLHKMHSHDRRTDTQLDAHIAFLHSLPMFGVSDHDLMFSTMEKEVEDDGVLDQNEENRLVSLRKQAESRLMQESSQQSNMQDLRVKLARSHLASASAHNTITANPAGHLASASAHNTITANPAGEIFRPGDVANPGTFATNRPLPPGLSVKPARTQLPPLPRKAIEPVVDLTSSVSSSATSDEDTNRPLPPSLGMKPAQTQPPSLPRRPIEMVVSSSDESTSGDEYQPRRQQPAALLHDSSDDKSTSEEEYQPRGQQSATLLSDSSDDESEPRRQQSASVYRDKKETSNSRASGSSMAKKAAHLVEEDEDESDDDYFSRLKARRVLRVADESMASLSSSLPVEQGLTTAPAEVMNLEQRTDQLNMSVDQAPHPEVQSASDPSRFDESGEDVANSSRFTSQSRHERPSTSLDKENGNADKLVPSEPRSSVKTGIVLSEELKETNEEDDEFILRRSVLNMSVDEPQLPEKQSPNELRKIAEEHANVLNPSGKEDISMVHPIRNSNSPALQRDLTDMSHRISNQWNKRPSGSFEEEEENVEKLQQSEPRSSDEINDENEDFMMRKDALNMSVDLPHKPMRKSVAAFYGVEDVSEGDYDEEDDDEDEGEDADNSGGMELDFSVIPENDDELDDMLSKSFVKDVSHMDQ